MKKYTAFILSIVLLISFTACSSNTIDRDNDSQHNNSVHIDESKETYNLTNEYLKNENKSEQERGECINNTENIGDIEMAEKPDNEEDESEKSTVGSDGTEFSEENLLPDEINSITRNEAGLTTISNLDFDGFVLNPSIQRLIVKPGSYSDEDYKNGLVYDKFLIISERFCENIIQDIKIGDNISKVTEQLGEPSCIIGNTMFFKTKEYYLGIKGDERVELAVFSKKPAQYADDILKTIVINANNSNFHSIPDLLSENIELSDFFDHSGHIHGGGWYAFSNNGICIEEFTDNTITVYNNFEGDLYKLQEGLHKYQIIYRNIDYMMDQMVSALNGYFWTSDIFGRQGKVSPGGKYNSVYLWNYSESYYFIIRAIDNSTPDKYIALPATGDYYWLNDRYILYSDFFSFAPYVVDVETYETINLLEQTELFNVDEYGFYFFEIKSYKDGKIVVYQKDKSKEYQIYYDFDSNGKIRLQP